MYCLGLPLMTLAISLRTPSSMGEKGETGKLVKPRGLPVILSCIGGGFWGLGNMVCTLFQSLYPCPDSLFPGVGLKLLPLPLIVYLFCWFAETMVAWGFRVSTSYYSLLYVCDSTRENGIFISFHLCSLHFFMPTGEMLSFLVGGAQMKRFSRREEKNPILSRQ